MKRLILISLVALGIIAVPQNVEAQGFLKKLSKGLESVNKGLDKAGDKASVATGQAVTQENGVFVMNPVSKAMNVEVVKAIGRSTSENLGKTQAFDADGNVYKMNMPSVSDRYDVTEGLPVKITCSPFLKVRKTASLAIVKIVAKCGDASGEITFKNVPIEWDPTEE